MSDVKTMSKPKSDGAETQPKPAAELANREERKADRLARRASQAAAVASSPFAFVRRFGEEMDRLIHEFSGEHPFTMPSFLNLGHDRPKWGMKLAEVDWSPRVDVRERDGKIVVRADLPGLSKDDIKVELGNEVITIEGERKEEKQEEREGTYYSECSYGHFYRSIPLPQGIDTSKATAEFHGGVLEISMPAPKTAPAAKRLEIQEKK